MPSFAYNCGVLTTDCDPNSICQPTNSEYNNGISYQSNSPWTSPKDAGIVVSDTLNGTPSDGMEGAFNGYLNEYLEVYVGDLDHAAPQPGQPIPWDAPKWAAGLMSWHDYFAHLRTRAPIEGPAGLTVVRSNASNNTVSWYPAYGATSYTLQRRSLSPLTDWANATGCDPSATSCIDTTTAGSAYAYRVQASDSTGTNLSTWSEVAVFLSEPSFDGYVSNDSGAYTPFPNATQPGIQAGQGTTNYLSGFVSFNTASLGTGTTVLDAKLRLRQCSNNDAFDALGSCLVDIQMTNFNDNVNLEAADYLAVPTNVNVAEEGALSGVDAGNWIEAELDPLYLADINRIDCTQFRLYFTPMNGVTNKTASWYSGESVGNEPQLIVQYSEP